MKDGTKSILKYVFIILSFIGIIVETVRMITTVIQWAVGTGSVTAMTIHIILFIICSVLFGIFTEL